MRLGAIGTVARDSQGLVLVAATWKTEGFLDAESNMTWMENVLESIRHLCNLEKKI